MKRTLQAHFSSKPNPGQILHRHWAIALETFAAESFTRL